MDNLDKFLFKLKELKKHCSLRYRTVKACDECRKTEECKTVGEIGGILSNLAMDMDIRKFKMLLNSAFGIQPIVYPKLKDHFEVHVKYKDGTVRKAFFFTRSEGAAAIEDVEIDAE